MASENNILNIYFDEDFIKTNNIEGIHKKEKLYSKKNEVYKIELIFNDSQRKTFVLKEYSVENKAVKICTENYFYNILKSSDLKTPIVYYAGNERLVLEYLEGELLIDHVTGREQSGDKEMIKSLNPDLFHINYPFLVKALEYINNFNKFAKSITGQSFILYDMNLRNFIIRDNEIYRVDFEDCRKGRLAEDAGRFIAFFLAYDPAFTEWKLAVSGMLKEFCKRLMGLDSAELEYEITGELEKMKIRRNTPII